MTSLATNPVLLVSSPFYGLSLTAAYSIEWLLECSVFQTFFVATQMLSEIEQRLTTHSFLPILVTHTLLQAYKVN